MELKNKNKIDWYEVVFSIGKMSGCHQIPERSFYFKGKQFPVCARCTGAFIGYYAGMFTFFLYQSPIWISLLFCVLLFIDWFLQYKKWLMSTNTRRFFTGTLCGYGLIQISLKMFLAVIDIIV